MIYERFQKCKGFFYKSYFHRVFSIDTARFYAKKHLFSASAKNFVLDIAKTAKYNDHIVND